MKSWKRYTPGVVCITIFWILFFIVAYLDRFTDAHGNVIQHWASVPAFTLATFLGVLGALQIVHTFTRSYERDGEK